MIDPLMVSRTDFGRKVIYKPENRPPEGATLMARLGRNRFAIVIDGDKDATVCKPEEVSWPTA